MRSRTRQGHRSRHVPQRKISALGQRVEYGKGPDERLHPIEPWFRLFAIFAGHRRSSPPPQNFSAPVEDTGLIDRARHPFNSHPTVHCCSKEPRSKARTTGWQRATKAAVFHDAGLKMIWRSRASTTASWRDRRKDMCRNERSIHEYRPQAVPRCRSCLGGARRRSIQRGSGGRGACRFSESVLPP